MVVELRAVRGDVDRALDVVDRDDLAGVRAPRAVGRVDGLRADPDPVILRARTGTGARGRPAARLDVGLEGQAAEPLARVDELVDAELVSGGRSSTTPASRRGRASRAAGRAASGLAGRRSRRSDPPARPRSAPRPDALFSACCALSGLAGKPVLDRRPVHRPAAADRLAPPLLEPVPEHPGRDAVVAVVVGEIVEDAGRRRRCSHVSKATTLKPASVTGPSRGR